MTDRRRVVVHLMLGLIMGMPIACRKSGTDRMKGTGPDALQQPSSERMSNLRLSVNDLKRTLSQLPANDPERDRKLTAQALGQTAAALAAIEGPNPSGSYRQQIRVIEDSRKNVERAGASVPTEPATDSGLRAAYNALISLRDGRFSGNQQVSQLVSDVAQKIPQLDTVRGPLHTLAVSDVMGSVYKSLVTMVDVEENRARAMQAPAPAPAPTTRPVAGQQTTQPVAGMR